MNTLKLSNVSSKYGAPMGRADRLPDDPLAPIDLQLARLPMVDGDYDEGGAYWGGPCDAGVMWCAWREGVQVFCRAVDATRAQAKVRAVLPGAQFFDTDIALSDFARGFITAALWLFDETPGQGNYAQGGRPDELIPQIDTTSLGQMVEDCRRFCEENEELLADAGSPAQNGHDFWLTRNHHGAGFWDRGYAAEVGKKLTKAAHAFGEISLYRGYDGRIYVQ
jgi:hypothetical protein